MRVLVTGGCGMIGFHAAKYYHEAGHEVTVMDNLERSSLLGHEVNAKRQVFNRGKLIEMGISVLPYDVSDRGSFAALQGHDWILHFAGQCGVPTSIEDPRRDFEVNAIGTFNVLEYARANDSVVAYASTNKVYPIHDGFVKAAGKWHFAHPGWDMHGVPVTGSLTGARTPYGTSKYTGDLLCQEYAHTYGLRTGVFRMSCIYGPSQFGFEEQGWATWFIIAKMKGWPITIYGDGDQVRDMLYVEDCVKAYDAFIQSDVHDGVWNLGGGVNNTLTLNEHLKEMDAILPNINNSPVTFDDWRPLDQKCYVSDLRPIMQELDWRPTVHPAEGLARTTAWVDENLEIF
jgi:CDP-paratose 2-epimerase